MPMWWNIVEHVPTWLNLERVVYESMLNNLINMLIQFFIMYGGLFKMCNLLACVFRCIYCML
jgi:hypothetical protein